MLRAAVDALRSAGARLDEQARPVDLAEAHRLFESLFEATVSPGLPDDVFAALSAAASAPADSGEPPALVQARAATTSHRDWLRLHQQRLRLGARWAEFFGSFDAAGVPGHPDRRDAARPRRLAARTITVNGWERSTLEQSVWPGLAGAATPTARCGRPVGRPQQGLPVGTQVLAPYLEDRTAVDVARRIAEVAGGCERPPA